MDHLVSASSNAICNPAGVWIIGGSSVYQQAMAHPACKRLFITRVWKTNNTTNTTSSNGGGEIECDTFLPEIDGNRYTLASDTDLKEIVGDASFDTGIWMEKEYSFKFEMYKSMT